MFTRTTRLKRACIKIICMVTFWSCIKYILIKYKSQSKLKKRHHIIPNFPNNFRKSEITYILTIIISPPNFLHYNFDNIHKILIVWLQYGADSCSMQHYWKPIFDDDRYHLSHPSFYQHHPLLYKYGIFVITTYLSKTCRYQIDQIHMNTLN